jgi:hypothetical protein
MSENIFNNCYSDSKTTKHLMAFNPDVINHNQLQDLEKNNNKINYLSEVANQNTHFNKNNPNLVNFYDNHSIFPSFPLFYPKGSSIQGLDSEFSSLVYQLNQSLFHINYSDKSKLNDSAFMNNNLPDSLDTYKSFQQSNNSNRLNTEGKINIQHKIILSDQFGNNNSKHAAIVDEDSRIDGKLLNGKYCLFIKGKELEFYEQIIDYVKNEMKQTVVEIFLKYLETKGFSITPNLNNQEANHSNDCLEMEAFIKNSEIEKQLNFSNMDGLVGKRNKDILKCPHKNRKHYAKVIIIKY